MFFYFLKLAWKSVTSTPGLTALTILAIGLGVAVPTTILSIEHLFAQNPIPHKSDRLFNVRVDSWETDSEFFGIQPGDPPKHITYRDMVGLRAITEGGLGGGSTGIAAASIYVFPEDSATPPYSTVVRLCHADFFSIFDVPFAYGGPWSDEVDKAPRPVVVLSHESNQKLFGGADSVGESVRLGEHLYQVLGVLAPYRPTPQYYDVINNAFGTPREFFAPFDLARNEGLGLQQTGDSDAWGPFGDSLEEILDASELTFIQFWVELAPEDVDDYAAAVDNYARSQKDLGRFPRPLNNRVTPLMDWLEVRNVVPPATRALSIIALLFLAVCCLNLTGLLLSKFLSRSGVVGVHRALGASRRSIFIQRIIECELIGVVGGVLGIALAALALEAIDRSVPSFVLADGLFTINTYAVTVAIALALVAGLLSGLYPAWRACRLPPAIQLKTQ